MNTKGMKELKPKLDMEIIIAVVVIALSFIGAWQVIFGPWVGEVIDKNIVTEKEMRMEFERRDCEIRGNTWQYSWTGEQYCAGTTTSARIIFRN